MTEIKSAVVKEAHIPESHIRQLSFVKVNEELPEFQLDEPAEKTVDSKVFRFVIVRVKGDHDAALMLICFVDHNMVIVDETSWATKDVSDEELRLEERAMFYLARSLFLDKEGLEAGLMRAVANSAAAAADEAAEAAAAAAAPDQ